MRRPPDWISCFSQCFATRELGHDIDHPIDVGVGHPRIDRKREGSLVDLTRDRQIVRAIAESLLVVGMKMQWNEVDRDSDPSICELFDELVTADLDALTKLQDIQV